MVEPKKSLGQNFLVDRSVVRNLVETAKITRSNLILEVGAGTGIVTKEIAQQAGRVVAVEFDRDLIPLLKENLEKVKNVEIINADILDFNIKGCFQQFKDLEKFKIIGSIPYQITSPLIHKLIETPGWLATVLLVQREVAEKIAAQPPKATYLSNFISAFAQVDIVKNVPKTAFKPQPEVDGAIVKIIREKAATKYPNLKPHEWSRFLHQGFAHPRKMLRNIFPEDKLERAGIDPHARAEELKLEEWFKLFKSLNFQSTS